MESADDTTIAAFYASLPTKRVAAGALFFDAAGRVLLVRPTYKPHWEFPGGSADVDEPPLACARREIEEELGLPLPIGRLLGVDWVNRGPPRNEGLMFLFDGGVLETSTIDRIRLPADELSEFRFVDLDDAEELLAPHMHRRLAATVAAHAAGASVYLENGMSVA
jgi:8-oxo-dGTP pyrophosphatase MutT (NUDIX family)